MLVDEWALWIMASHLRVTSHLGIKGELRIISLAADILVSNRTILLVCLNLGLNICSSLQAPKTKIVFFNQPLIGETKYFIHRIA
ncbi:hypothetical protein ES703_80984 [subsurface metagenome]